MSGYGGGGGNMGRPKKHPSDTARGQRELKREAKLAQRADKARKEDEKKRLSGLGLCKTPDGEVTTNSQAGRLYGDKGKDSGHLGKDSGHLGKVFGAKGAVSGLKGGVSGVKAWEGASSEDRAARKEAGNTRGR